MKRQLTKEQSKRLIELGITAEKASASIAEETQGNGNSWTYPVFTIGDLLEVLPKEIERNDLYAKISISGFLQFWSIGYYNDSTEFLWFSANGEELIEVLYDTVIWCIENGFVKTDKQ